MRPGCWRDTQTMQKNVQSIAPSFTPVTSPQIDDPEPQGTLPTGPTGVVHRGGGGAPWHKRLALTTAPSPTAHHVLLTLGSFVSDGDKDAWPSVLTLASMTGLTRRTVQRALRALEDARLVQTVTVTGQSSRYRLTTGVTGPQGGRKSYAGGGVRESPGGASQLRPKVQEKL